MSRQRMLAITALLCGAVLTAAAEASDAPPPDSAAAADDTPRIHRGPDQPGPAERYDPADLPRIIRGPRVPTQGRQQWRKVSPPRKQSPRPTANAKRTGRQSRQPSPAGGGLPAGMTGLGDAMNIQDALKRINPRQVPTGPGQRPAGSPTGLINGLKQLDGQLKDSGALEKMVPERGTAPGGGSPEGLIDALRRLEGDLDESGTLDKLIPDRGLAPGGGSPDGLIRSLRHLGERVNKEVLPKLRQIEQQQTAPQR